MTSRFSVPGGDVPEETIHRIDTDKRYDVYCLEFGQTMTVHHNVRFKGTGRLLQDPDDRLSVFDYVELLQPNDQSIYIQRSRIAYFCEHGTKVMAERVRYSQD